MLKRFISVSILAVFGIPFILISPPQLFGLLVAVISWQALREYLTLTLGNFPQRQAYFQSGMILGIVVSLSFIAFSGSLEALTGSFVLASVILLSIDLIVRRSEQPTFSAATPIVIFGILYTIVSLSYLTRIRYLADGKNIVSALLLITWSRDIGAALYGWLIKSGYPLSPLISPRKTLQGSIGSFLISLTIAFLFRDGLLPGVDTIELIVLVAVLALLGQIGDLVESLIKRVSSAIDSSNLIPGQGGILDSFDSIIFTAPVMYYFFCGCLLVS